MEKIYVIPFVILMAIFNPCFSQHAGDLDPQFNQTGIFTLDFYERIDVLNDIAVQPDGKVVACGMSFTPDWNINVKIIRLLPDGSLDTEFNGDGIVNYNPFVSGYYETHAQACVIRDNGKILCAGAVFLEGRLQFLLIQLNEDGSFDQDFGTNGISVVSVNDRDNIALDVALDENGKIVVAGIITDEDYNNLPAVARFNEDGSLDPMFGNFGISTLPVISPDNEFASISLQEDGKIVASGHYAYDLSIFAGLVTRFLPDGQLDETFGDNGVVKSFPAGTGYCDFQGMDLSSDGSIVCGGSCIQGNGSYFAMVLMKYDTLGNIYTDFGLDGVVTLHFEPYNFNGFADLLIQPDCKILACGNYGDFVGDKFWSLLRFKESGGIDYFFAADGVSAIDFSEGQDEARSLALSGDDRIYAGGKSSSDFILDYTIVAYYNDMTTSIGNSPVNETVSVYPNPVSGNASLIGATNSEAFLYNTAGQLIRKWKVDSDVYSLDFSACQPGIYFVRTESADASSIVKVIIQ